MSLAFRAFAALPPGLGLRDATPADRPFLERLYASTRADELAPLGWDDERTRAFLADQFALQHDHYRAHYPGAEWLIVTEASGAPIGRVYLMAGRDELRLMDLALLPASRGCGVGTALAREVLRYADARALRVTLHVEPFNPAMRLYARLGFRTLEMRGIYAFMERTSGNAGSPGSA